MVEAWMMSPPHRANILNAEYEDLGIGIVRDAQKRPYATLVFGKQ